MKKFIKNNILGFLIGFIVAGTMGVFAVSQVLSKDISYDNSTSGLNATNAQDAIDEIYQKELDKQSLVGTQWTYDYEGKEESFTVPVSGSYKLEVWGASGGYYTVNTSYGYGGYSVGEISLKEDEVLYINVGGAGKNCTTSGYCSSSGGYNGGGNAYYSNQQSSGGGGATHIATESGLLANVSVGNVLIVAGGGGGSGYAVGDTYTYYGYGGSAGGYIGNNGTDSSFGNPGFGGSGASQSGGGYPHENSNMVTDGIGIGSYGQGGYATSLIRCCGNNGGGGGLYGGGASTRGHGGGGGGSSYIGNSRLTNKAMYCYSCSTSSTEAIKTISTTNLSGSPISGFAKTGNGYAIITLLSTE